jgi:hypothetical protein
MTGLARWAAQAPAGGGETLGLWTAALLTLAVLSYVLGRNVAFRLAEHLFVGVAAGYGAALAWTMVLAPRARTFLADPVGHWHYGLFFGLGLALLARSARRLSPLANLPLAVLFGAGAGLALGGALTGTLVGQVRGALVSVAPAAYGPGVVGWAYAADALLLTLGTVAVLASYQFTAGYGGRLGAAWGAALRPLRALGRGFILVAFGALLGGAILSFFALLSGRLDFLLSDWLGPLMNGVF